MKNKKLKKVFLLFVVYCLIISCIPSSCVVASSSSKAKYAYKRWLTKHSGYKFALCKINNDTTPELVIRSVKPKLTTWKIYTYSSGKIKYVKTISLKTDREYDLWKNTFQYIPKNRSIDVKVSKSEQYERIARENIYLSTNKLQKGSFKKIAYSTEFFWPADIDDDDPKDSFSFEYTTKTSTDNIISTSYDDWWGAIQSEYDISKDNFKTLKFHKNTYKNRKKYIK